MVMLLVRLSLCHSNGFIFVREIGWKFADELSGIACAKFGLSEKPLQRLLRTADTLLDGITRVCWFSGIDKNSYAHSIAHTHRALMHFLSLWYSILFRMQSIPVQHQSRMTISKKSVLYCERICIPVYIPLPMPIYVLISYSHFPITVVVFGMRIHPDGFVCVFCKCEIT